MSETEQHLTEQHLTEQHLTEQLLAQPQYGFLKTDPHLGKHIILLGWRAVMPMGRIRKTVILMSGE